MAAVTVEMTSGVAAHVERRLGAQLRVRGWILRVSLAGVMVAVAALIGIDGDTVKGYGYLIAFAWVPAVGLVEALRRRSSSPIGDFAALALDWAFLGVTAAVVGDLAVLSLAAQLPLVAYYAHQDPRRLGMLAALFALALAVVVTVVELDTVSLRWGALLLYGSVVLGLYWVQSESGHERTVSALTLADEHHRSEAILTGVGEAVVVTGQGGRVRSINAAAERAFACSSDVATGASCRDILELHQGLLDFDCSSGCALVAAQADAGGDVEVWRQLATGKRQPFLASAQPVHDGDGNVVEVVHSLRDITKIKEAEEAKTVFLATASHELKTPLTVIRGFAEMLQQRYDDVTAEQREVAIDAIVSRTRQLTDVVERLLLSSQIEAGRAALRVDVYDIVPNLTERVESFRDSAEHEIVLYAEHNLPTVRVDETGFVTAIDHLLENAIKYSPDGGRIDVHALSDDRRVRVMVADHGIGMTSEQIAHCYERFWRAEQTNERRFGGSGIGLYIVKSLIVGMGGEIHVDSAVGRGTQFTIVLERGDRAPEVPEEAPRSGQGEKSIVVEFMRQVGVTQGEPR